jgi:hypothetical protein
MMTTSRPPRRRCFLAWRRSLTERLFFPGPATNTGKVFSSTLWFSSTAYDSRDPQALAVATYHYLVRARSWSSQSPCTESLEWRLLTPSGVCIEPLYIVVAGRRVRMHSLSTSALMGADWIQALPSTVGPFCLDPRPQRLKRSSANRLGGCADHLPEGSDPEYHPFALDLRPVR